MAHKPSIGDLMRERDLDISGLARQSGVAPETARRAADPHNHARLNTGSATSIAGGFGLEVGDINWPISGLTNRGRTGGSGKH